MTTQEQIEQAIATGTAPAGLRGQPDYQHVYYSGSGQPYYKTVGGGTQYIPPAAAMSLWDEPKARAWAARPENGGFAIDAATPDELQQKTQGAVDASGVYHDAAPVVHGKAPETGFWQTDPVWNSETGQYESGFNWEHLADLGVGGLIAAPAIAAAAPALAGGGAAGGAGGTSGGLGFTSGLGANATLGSVLGNPLVQGGIKTGIDAARGNLSWKDALNFVPAIPGVGNVGGAITSNPIAKGAINAGVQSGINSAATGQFDPRKTAFDIAGGAVPGVSASLTNNPIARRAITGGLNVGLNTAKTGQFNPVQAAVAGGRVVMPTTTSAGQTGIGMPPITRKFLSDDSSGDAQDDWLAALTPVDEGGDPTDPNDPAYTGGWPSNDNVGPDPGDYDGVVAPLPSTPTPGMGLPLPPGGTGGTPSRGVPLPSVGGPSTPPSKTPGVLDNISKVLEGPFGGLLGGFLSGLGQSMFQQKRQSFAGTAADPAAVMGDLGTGLKGLIGNFQTRNDAGVGLPDAYVDTRAPTFTGGGMAMPVGQLPDFGAAVSAPVSLQNGIIRRDSTAQPSPPPGGHTQADRDRALSALNLLGVGVS